MLKIGATRVSDAIELLPTKYMMPKSSSNDYISAAFDKTDETLNTPKLKEGLLNGNKENKILNEIVEICNKRNTVQSPRVIKMIWRQKKSHIYL